MQVRPGTGAGAANKGYFLSLGNGLAHADKNFTVVGIAGCPTVAMVDIQIQAVAIWVVAHARHLPGCGRDNGIALRIPDVDAGMFAG